jgi:D-alanine-D-alanine ligase
MGGNSGEYDISLQSGTNIAKSLDKERYQVFVITIRYQDWYHLADNGNRYYIDKNDFTLGLDGEKISFDCVCIAIHGNPGEDGKLQGYFDMLGLPYTGCNATVSALTFNKHFCNRVVASFGVKTAPSISLFKGESMDEKTVSEQVGYPCFVKPCHSGSSVGISKVCQEKELAVALSTAFRYDHQLLIEQFVKGREITCGVLKRNGNVASLAVTEIVSKKEYFDYEAKYNPALADEITPASVAPAIEKRCRETSQQIYTLLGCRGIARIDYIFNETGMYFIEINTIPGQTNESIIPKQVRYCGLDFMQLCTDSIEDAIQERSAIQTKIQR